MQLSIDGRLPKFKLAGPIHNNGAKRDPAPVGEIGGAGYIIPTNEMLTDKPQISIKI